MNTLTSGSPELAELVSAALVGTDRKAAPGGPAPGGDPALDLLARVSLALVPQRVGDVPAPFDGALPAPMPADQRPPLPAAATVRLRSVIDSYTRYLPQWLSAARAGGYQLPGPFLPELLELGRSNVLIRADIAAVAGAPGRWLAAHNSAWRYLLREARETMDPRDWTGPDPDARVAYAASLYLEDPAAARALIARDWAQQRVPVKMGLLHQMGSHPDRADLEFAETLSADTSKQVRDEAAQLVTSLRDRRDREQPPPFTGEMAAIIAVHGVSRELHNFLMSRLGEPWPQDGARLLADSLAAHSARQASAASHTQWIVTQLQTALADHAPVSLRPHIARLVTEQHLAGPDAAAPQVDFSTVLTLIDYRRDLLAELAPPAHAPSGQE